MAANINNTHRETLPLPLAMALKRFESAMAALMA